jgi:hypothetical protein
VLEPERRQPLIGALRPPPGYTFDCAVGTTFTLDLNALLLAPVAFAMFDVEADNGRPLANPVAVVEAVRRHAQRTTVFAQAGEIRVPPFRPALAYLESAVVPVRAPRPGGIFHPKIWVMRFVGGGDARYRFLCLSRNLTFDRSWDTILRLDGTATTAPDERSRPLAEFVAALPGLAVAPVTEERRQAIGDLAAGLASVAWDPLPDGLAFVRMCPIGHDGRRVWPFPSDGWRRLVVSPFVGADFLADFLPTPQGHVVVSRPETLDALGQAALARATRTCVLDADAEQLEAASVTTDEAPDGGSDALRGLHAKLFVVDQPWWSRIWTGSANATRAAFDANVEFLVELRGRNTAHGVKSLTAPAGQGALGFGDLLADHVPAFEPVPESAAEVAEREIDALARAIGSLRFTADVERLPDDLFRVRLSGSGSLQAIDDWAASHERPPALAVRPVSLGAGLAVEPRRDGERLTAEWDLSFAALTAFFVVDITPAAEPALACSFLVRAELRGDPADRLDRILAAELRSSADLIRLILLLLGQSDAAFDELAEAVTDGRWGGSARSDGALGPNAVLEPLLRALAREEERVRLDDIARVVAELERTDEGKALLPAGWHELWAAVETVRAAEVRRDG